MGLNDKLVDRFIGHEVNLQRLQASQRKKILVELKRLEAKIVKQVQAEAGETFTKARQTALLRNVREIIRTGYKQVAKVHQHEVLAMAEHELATVGKLVNSVAKAEILAVGVPESVVKSLLKDDVVLGAPVKAIWEQEAGALHQAFVAQMRQGILAGDTTDQLVRRVSGTAALNYKDGIMNPRERAVDMRVRTSAQSILNDARMEVYKQNQDVLEGVQAQVTLDDRTSEICMARSGMAWDFEGKPLNEETDEDFPGPPPWHPNAVLNGSTFMSYGRLDEMVGADYHGPAILVKTAEGKDVTIGPNHPILTSRGMVRARDLKEGDQLIYDRRVDVPLTVQQTDFKQVPMVEDVFQTLSAAGFRTRPTVARHDFHGDGVFCHGEVKIVEPADGLLVVWDSCGIEQFRKGGFPRTNVQSVLPAGHRPRDLGFEGVNLATASGMCGRLASHYLPVSIQSIHYVEWVGKAFDATTASGLYNCNGFVVSNCRTTLVPVVKSIGEIIDDPNIDDTIKKEAGKLPPRTQASMDGQVPASLTYEDWLKRKPAEFQKEVLGPGKYRLWKQGKISLRDLIDQKGNPLTIEELRRL